MSKSSVTLFRGFAEDRWPSMEMYSDNLVRALHDHGGDTVDLLDYRPTIPAWTRALGAPAGFRIRYGRYVSYPAQARRRQGTVNHILDQSYAHLVGVLDAGRTIVTVHDLIPLLAWKRVIPGLGYPHYPALFKLAVAGLRKARLLIAVSHSTKQDLVEHAQIEESRIAVIHNGLDDRFTTRSPAERIALRAGFGFPDRRSYLVLISGSQPYKNLTTSLRVVVRLQERLSRPVQLVWLGADESSHDPEERLLNAPIIRLNGLAVSRLVDLYNSVDCLLFPSVYEGFGWPPLEAMACGTPVVTSNVASLPEVVGNAALTAPPQDVGLLTDAVASALEDDSVRQRCVTRGRENAALFKWQENAAAVRDLYGRVKAGAR